MKPSSMPFTLLQLCFALNAANLGFISKSISLKMLSTPLSPTGLTSLACKLVDLSLVLNKSLLNKSSHGFPWFSTPKIHLEIIYN